MARSENPQPPLSEGEREIDEAVARSVAEHAAWLRQALPSLGGKIEPRVFISEDGFEGLRRPFKRKGRWCVRVAGTARLVNPHESVGQMVFELDWSRYDNP